MLILTYTNRLGINLHQFRQRILHTAGNGNSRPQIDIEFREFLRRQLGCGIYGCSRLVDDHIADTRKVFQHFHSHSFRFTGCSTVADRDVLDTMFANHPGQDVNCLLLFPFGKSGIYYIGIQHRTGRIHNRHLAAIAVTGIQAHSDKSLYRRLHQKGF